jgi:hypothetical protein
VSGPESAGPAGEGSDDAVLRETLEALEMPRAGLQRWLAANERFCRGHGARHYRELLDLYRRMRAVLDGAGR